MTPEQTAEEFKPSFVDAQNREWSMRVNTKLVLKMCREFRLTVGNFCPGKMDDGMLMELAWRSVQHVQYVKPFLTADNPFDEWIDEVADGKYLNLCLEAANNALVNFTLNRLDGKEKVAMTAIYRNVFKDAKEEKERIANGEIETSSNLQQEQELTPAQTTPSES